MTEYYEKAARSIANIIYLCAFILAVTLLGLSFILTAIIWLIGEFAIFIYYFIRGTREENEN